MNAPITVSPDPVALFRETLHSQCLDALKAHCVYGAEDGGDFAHFQAKFNLAICIYRHWWNVLGQPEEILHRVFAHHRREGLRYVEYRAMAPYDHTRPEAFVQFHALTARAIAQACTERLSENPPWVALSRARDHSPSFPRKRESSGRGLNTRNGNQSFQTASEDFTARYLISLPRWAPLECYKLVQRLLDENEDLIPTIVGLDFCHFEEGYPPASTRAFFRRLRHDNERHPERALDVAYHVGESYFDKSLESAVRWCHQAAELGALRLGHCTALGLDPEVAVARRSQAHECERVSEALGPDRLRFAPQGRIGKIRRPGR